MGRVKRIWYLSPMRTAMVQASLRIRAVLPEPPLLAQTGSESRETFRQKARSLAPLNGWACAVKICHDGMLEDTNSLDGAPIPLLLVSLTARAFKFSQHNIYICYQQKLSTSSNSFRALIGSILFFPAPLLMRLVNWLGSSRRTSGFFSGGFIFHATIF